MTAEPFLLQMFQHNLADWVQNESKMDYLTMSPKYSHKIWLQMVWNKNY